MVNMSITKDYVISVRLHADIGERFENVLEKLKKKADKIPRDKYITMTVNKSTIIEDLVKQFCDDMLDIKGVDKGNESRY